MSSDPVPPADDSGDALEPVPQDPAFSEPTLPSPSIPGWEPPPGLALLAGYVGKEIVVDLSSPYVHLGTLVQYDSQILVLEEADVHDLRDTSSSRELYVLDSRRFGVRANRKRVLIRLSEVVSLSALEEILLH